MASSVERITVAAVIAAIALPIAFVGLRGLGVPWPVAAPLVVILGAAGAFWLARRLPVTLDGVRRIKPWWCAAWLLLALVALVQTTRLSAFMLDGSQAQHSMLPHDPWYVRHCCLTAYSESARLAEAGDPNLYRVEHYRDRFLGRFQVDAYHYPPTFLLVPSAVRAVVGDSFLAMRSVWFGLSGLALLVALLLVAQHLEPGARTRAIALLPAVWISAPALVGLQMSNVQVLVLAISALALVAFPRFPAVGGALLALATVSKLFPGILFVYLLLARKWREAAWTAGFAAVFCLLALVVVGPTPFRAFIDYELPRLSSGEAFTRPFSRPFAVAANMSAFGIAMKLQWLGVPGMSLGAGRVLSALYALGVLALVIRVGRRSLRTRGEETTVWLALLSLGTLASPFAPANYVLLSLVWLLCVDRSVVKRATSTIAAWVALSAPLLLPRESSPYLLLLIVHIPAQALALAVPALALLRAGTPRPAKT